MKTDASSENDSNQIERQRALIEKARLQAAKSRTDEHANREIDPLSGSTSDEYEDSIIDAGGSFCGYTILEEIHRGAQGIVHRAIDNKIKRVVALKVLREGPFASPRELARFEREIQVLGQLNHPNIVAIHHTGESAGHYFFVMDYVDGKPLDKFLFGSDSGHENSIATPHSLPDVDDALALFRTICEAVHAAHLHGVIHRDLKPNNILVDGNGEPHILDFGLAKFAGIESNASAMTVTGQFVGSAPWSSPEQSESGSEFIDVRSDVYSLGVILFQMLTGTFPYAVYGNIRDVLNQIANQEPVSPRSIRNEIDDEVETILLKCLNKRPEQRYQSARELARDIERHLANEPIEAKRDSTLYVLRKYLQRHRFAAFFAAFFVLFITVSAVGLSFLYAQQRAANNRAEQQTHLAELNASRAEHEAESSRLEQGRVKAINQFLTNMLSSADPQVSNGKEVSVRETLDKASAMLDSGSLKDRPGIEASVRTTLGNAYLSIGKLAESEIQLRKALSIKQQGNTNDQLDTASSLHNLGILMWTKGQFPEAHSLLEDALAVRKRLLGNEHIDVSESMDYLAQVLRDEGHLLQAEALFRENLELTRRLLGDDHIDLARTQSNLAKVLQIQGKYSEAELLFIRSLAIYRKTNPGDSPDVAAGLKNLGSLLGNEDRLPEAEQLLRESLEIWRRLWEDKDSGIFMAMIYDALGALLQEEGKLDEAEPLLRQAFDFSQKVYGNSHPNVALCANDLAILLTSKGDFENAELLFHKSLDVRRQRLGNDHFLVAECLDGLAELNRLQGKLSEAESNSREAVIIRRAATPIILPHDADSVSILGAVLIAEAKASDAEPFLRECLDIRSRTLASGNWRIAEAQGLLGASLTVQRKNDEAVEMLDICYTSLKDTTQVNSSSKKQAIQRISEILAAYGEKEQSHRFLALYSR